MSAGPPGQPAQPPRPPRPAGRVTVLPAGAEALLLEVAGLDEVLAFEGDLREVVARGTGPWAGVTDVVPAARTVLLVTRPGTDLTALAAAVRELGDPAPDRRDSLPEQDDFVRLGRSSGHPRAHETALKSHEVEIPVTYDGPDLDDVAGLTGLTPAEVVSAHTGMPWRVAFGGFAPGFAYLVGGDPRLSVPRRAHPRASVPAGAVGVAGEFSGVYPRASPGGWRLLGTTDATLWDVERDPPALLTPGTTVRFVDVARPR